MTCKDCIHYEVCNKKDWFDWDYDCEYFKDKSRFIELPYKVGETVYEPLIYCDCGTVLSRCYTVDGCKDCVYHTAKVIEYKFNVGDYERLNGKEIFLTREEAEKALAERRKS